MTIHCFKIGDRVRIGASIRPRLGETYLDGIVQEWPEGIYEVTRLLPELDDGEPQYRVKGADGQNERVVQESRLMPAISKPQPHR
jgi:hypothetical protein